MLKRPCIGSLHPRGSGGRPVASRHSRWHRRSGRERRRCVLALAAAAKQIYKREGYREVARAPLVREQLREEFLGLTGRCQNDSVLAARCTCKALLRSAAAALEHLTARTLSTGGASRPGAHAITRILNASALSYRADRRLEPSQVVADHCERLFWWTPQLPPTRRRRPCRQRFGSHAPSVGTAEPASRT